MLAAAWCEMRKRAAHIQLDEVRDPIVAGLADPRVKSDNQAERFLHSVTACRALAREFHLAGYDVAVDDLLYAGHAFDHSWRKGHVDINWRLVIVRPSLAETLRRSKARAKRVPEALTQEQHDRRHRLSSRLTRWPVRRYRTKR
jgi:hypothetical protein